MLFQSSPTTFWQPYENAFIRTLLSALSSIISLIISPLVAQNEKSIKEEFNVHQLSLTWWFLNLPTFSTDGQGFRPFSFMPKIILAKGKLNSCLPRFEPTTMSKPSQCTTIKPIHVSCHFLPTMPYNLLSHNHACMQNN